MGGVAVWMFCVASAVLSKDRWVDGVFSDTGPGDEEDLVMGRKLRCGNNEISLPFFLSYFCPGYLFNRFPLPSRLFTTHLSLSIAIDIDRYLYLEREVDRESSLHLYTPPPRLAVTAVEAKPSATLSILRSCRFAWVCVDARRSKAKEQRCRT